MTPRQEIEAYAEACREARRRGGPWPESLDHRKYHLRGANLRWADLREADLRGTDLQAADLSGANLSGADLRGAKLRWAKLEWANLFGADLREADLQDTNLRARLICADLRGADLHGAVILEGATVDTHASGPEWYAVHFREGGVLLHIRGTCMPLSGWLKRRKTAYDSDIYADAISAALELAAIDPPHLLVKPPPYLRRGTGESEQPPSKVPLYVVLSYWLVILAISCVWCFLWP